MHTTGQVLQSRYEIESVLGQGGMGGVYKGRHRALDVEVAIKEMTLERSGEALEAAVRQFRHEAQILHELKHANLPRVHDFFEEEGKYYLVMDFIAGRSLEQVLRTRLPSEEEVLAWAQELCSVLDYLHGYTPPIIFRDLKPSNIMLGDDGHIKLIDFGIAKDLDTHTGRGTQTSVRGAGTPGFAAPEQYGQGSDVRTDVYALGATLYSLLTRLVPPDSVDIASGAAELKPLRDVRPDVTTATVQVIEWCLNINRTKRPGSIQEVAKALGVGGAPLSVRPVPSPQTMVSAGLPAAPPTRIDVDECQRQLDLERKPSFSRWGTLAAGLLAMCGVAGLAVQHHQAAPVAAHGLHIETQPPGAQVEVAGQQGTTPFELELSIPTAWVTISKAGYQTVREELPVPTSTSFTLVPDTPQVTFTGSPSGTEVVVDRTPVGTTTGTGLTVPMQVGPHQVALHMQGYQPLLLPVTVPEGGLSVPYHLSRDPKQFGSVALHGLPGGARVSLDGRSNPDLAHVLHGPHQLAITDDGFDPFHQTLKIRGGHALTVDIHLVRESAAAGQADHQVVVMPAPSAAQAPEETLIDSHHVGSIQVEVPAGPALASHPELVKVGETRYGTLYRGDRVTVLVGKAGRVARVVTGNPVYHTAEGITVGSSRADVDRCYGTSENTKGDWVVYNQAGIAFTFGGANRVTHMAIGHMVEKAEQGAGETGDQ